MIYKTNGAVLCYKENMGCVNDYYQSIVKMLKKIVETHKMSITIDEYCKNSIKISCNYEHTLVKPGGRSVPYGTPFGAIKDGNGPYFVRIDKYQDVSKADIIIDYSIPNIINVKSCPLYNSFSKKHIYISPSIYEPYFSRENRNIATLTTFINTNEPRRNKLLNTLIDHRNVNNCFDKDSMLNLLKNTKILINIHQTPHHHTFEELRVLPALECGVIVISEKSTLSELVPYHDLIIWTDYAGIPEKTKEIMEKYEEYHTRIFTAEAMHRLNHFKKINYAVLEKAVLNKISSIAGTTSI